MQSKEFSKSVDAISFSKILQIVLVDIPCDSRVFHHQIIELTHYGLIPVHNQNDNEPTVSQNQKSFCLVFDKMEKERGIDTLHTVSVNHLN